jgi:hypothetical protein
MDHLKEYAKIFEGGPFIRKGEVTEYKKCKVFDGGGVRSLLSSVFKELLTRESVTILDYGCGQAIHWHKQVLDNRTKTFVDLLGDKLQGFYRYDPAFKAYSRKPLGKFDFILCSDVLEHIPEEDIPNFVRELNSYSPSDGVIFYSISTKPSNNCFADGTNMHITQKPPAWWFKIVKDNSTSKSYFAFDGILE